MSSPDPQPSDYFGFSVSVSNDSFLIGEYGHVDGILLVGAAHIFSPMQVGNVSCDVQSNTVDALFILQYAVGIRSESTDCPLSDPASEFILAGCDANQDLSCDAADALLIVQCNVGQNNLLCPLN